MKKALAFGWFALLFVGFFLLSFYTPRHADDFGYLLNFYRPEPLLPGEWPTLGRFLSLPGMFSNLWDLTWTHYCHETGRYTTAFIMRLVSGLPQWAFALLNTGMFFAVLRGLVHYSGVTGARKVLLLIGGVLLLTQFQATLWLAGAVNYPWAVGWTLFLVPLFLSRRMQESVFVLRNAWFPFLVIPAFLAAGGHELVSASIGLLLAIYGVLRICKRSFRLDGQAFLTLGYGLGAIAVVFAPSTIHRADGGSFFAISNLPYYICQKGMAVVRCCQENPIVLCLIVLTFLLPFSSRLRSRISKQTWWCISLAWIMLVVTCLLTSGSGRTAWCVSASAVLVAGCLIRDFNLFLRPITLKWGVSILSILCFLMMGMSLQISLENRQTLRCMLADWQQNVHGVGHEMTEAEPPLGLQWFNRAWRTHAVADWGVSDPWVNPLVAKFYGREHCILLDKFTYDHLYSKDDICRQENRLALADTWYADSQADVLVQPLEQGGIAPVGSRIKGVPSYNAPKLSSLQRILSRLSHGGRTATFMASPEQEMDSNSPMPGFVLSTSHGNYYVLRHNHLIDRARLQKLTLEVPEQ